MNVQQGQSLLQIADGALAQVSTVLSRLLALASKSASGQVTDTQRREDIDTEYQSLVQEINTISSSAQYAGHSLLNFDNAHGAFSWNSSSVLTGFYEAQVLSNAHVGASSDGKFSGETGGFKDTGQVGQFTNGLNGLPIGPTGSFLASRFTEVGKYPFGPAKFLTGIGSVGAIGVSISAVTSASLGLEDDVVSYRAYNVTAVDDNGFLTPSDTYIADHPNAIIPGGMQTTVQAITSNVGTQSAAMTAMGVLNKAISKVAAQRSQVGAYESRFNFAEQVSQNDWQQTQAAFSVIADADVAGVKARLSSQDVGTQAAIAATVQAAQLPSELLKLIQS